MKIDKFTESYITAALWSETDDNEQPLEDSYSAADIADDALAAIVEDCALFLHSAADPLAAADYPPRSEQWTKDELAGHDFWLTRNGHGTGFWDRGLGEIGLALTNIAHTFGEAHLYVGDEGKLYYFNH